MSNHHEGTPISQLMNGGGSANDDESNLVDQILADIGAAPPRPAPVAQQAPPQQQAPPTPAPQAAGGPTGIITDQNAQHSFRTAERQMDSGVVHQEDAMTNMGPTPATSTRIEGFVAPPQYAPTQQTEAPPMKQFSVWDIILEEMKTPILVAILVGLFVSPFFSELLLRVVPFVGAGSITEVVIKATLAGLIFYALKTAILY